MNKRIRALLLSSITAASLCGNAVAVDVTSSTNAITVDKNADTLSFSIYVTAEAAYAGAEFSLGTSSDTLQFESIQYANTLQNTQDTQKDGVLHFGFFAADNTYAPDNMQVATVTYRYSGSNDCQIELLDSQVYTVDADGQTVLTEDAATLFTVSVERESTSYRPSTGGSSSNSNTDDDEDADDAEDAEDTLDEEALDEEVLDQDGAEDDNKVTPQFTDTDTHWAKESIDFVVDRGLFNGVSDTDFAPNSSITRGMFITVLGRIAEADFPTGADFDDVANDAYYANYIAWSYENGIANGVSDTSFAPDAPITREQMAVMLSNYAAFAQTELAAANQAADFDDAHAISDWASEAVQLLQMAGVINGRDTGTFDPTATATRAEAATMFTRFIALL